MGSGINGLLLEAGAFSDSVLQWILILQAVSLLISTNVSNLHCKFLMTNQLSHSSHPFPSPPPSGTPESFHGLGLTVAYERSKALSATGKSCSSLLAEISSTTEAYSKKIEKACEVRTEE